MRGALQPSLSSTAAPPLRLNAAPSAGLISGNLSYTVTSSKPWCRSASAVVRPHGPAPTTAMRRGGGRAESESESESSVPPEPLAETVVP